MIIHGYIIAMPDDADVLPDALTSLAYFCDHLYVVDGGLGGGTLCHHPRYTEPISDWLYTREESLFGDTLVWSWNGVPLTLWGHSFQDPAHQRNWTLAKMLAEPRQPDWIAWIDSDEVCSWEFIRGVRPMLENLAPETTNITVKWLTLVQDERHCVEHMSNWLAHSRIHKPGSVIWQGNWHEHGDFAGARMQWEEGRVIHTRALFTERLKIQRGHDGIATGQTPLWADARMVDVPAGVTWEGLLHWPEGEHPMPFR